MGVFVQGAGLRSASTLQCQFVSKTTRPTSYVNGQSVALFVRALAVSVSNFDKVSRVLQFSRGMRAEGGRARYLKAVRFVFLSLLYLNIKSGQGF